MAPLGRPQDGTPNMSELDVLGLSTLALLLSRTRIRMRLHRTEKRLKLELEVWPKER